MQPDSPVFYTVYQITNKVNGKIYVGYHHTRDLDDGYMGSGKLIRRAIEKYGPENFSKEILFVFDNQAEAEAKEAEIVNEEFVLRDDTYNVAIGGNVRAMPGENNPFFGKKHAPETIAKIVASHVGKRNLAGNAIFYIIDGKEVMGRADAISLRKCTGGQLHRDCGDPNKLNVRYKDDERQKEAEQNFIDWIKLSIKQRVLLAEITSERMTGRLWPEEQKQKLSQALKGRKMSPEHIDKVNRNPEKIRKTAEKHRGMKRSLETRRKQSIAKLGKEAKNKGKHYYIDPNDPSQGNYFLSGSEPTGWTIKKTTAVIVTCPYCKKSGGKAPMYRYHFERCKQKINQSEVSLVLEEALS